MTIKEFFSFRQNKYFWMNVIGMVVAIAFLIFGVFKGLDVYTRHGEGILVPDVKGLEIAQAEQVFRNRGLVAVVSDSSYMKNLPAGCILDYNPVAGQKVKKGRVIYLTVNSLSIPQVAVPDVADNSSVRQAQARMLASGFKLNEIEYIAGERDWVYGVKYRDRLLSSGEKIPVGATLTLVVGNGEDVVQADDSLDVDSQAVEKTPVSSDKNSDKKSAADESWF